MIERRRGGKERGVKDKDWGKCFLKFWWLFKGLIEEYCLKENNIIFGRVLSIYGYKLVVWY